MLRFFSRRHKPRRDQKQGAWDHRDQTHKLGPKEQKKRDKNIIPCRVILLDGTDLAVEIQVRSWRKTTENLFNRIFNCTSVK